LKCFFSFSLDGKRNKKDQARPDALPPSSGQAVAGQANAHGEVLSLLYYYFMSKVKVCFVFFEPPEALIRLESLDERCLYASEEGD
jgi:hypothetical protein